MFIINSPGRYKVKYLHLIIKEGLLVGDGVIPGEGIGKLGNEGKRTGYHVHYSIFDKEKGKNIENQSQFFRCGNGKLPSMGMGRLPK